MLTEYFYFLFICYLLLIQGGCVGGDNSYRSVPAGSESRAIIEETGKATRTLYLDISFNVPMVPDDIITIAGLTGSATADKDLTLDGADANKFTANGVVGTATWEQSSGTLFLTANTRVESDTDIIFTFNLAAPDDNQEYLIPTITLTKGQAITSVTLLRGGVFSQNRENIKIGFLNPKTGKLADYSPGYKWGADEAINDLKKTEGVEDNYKIELVEVNSGCNGETAVSAAQTLLDSGVSGVVGAACSVASMSANTVLSAEDIPMISYASRSPALNDNKAYPLFYRVVPSHAIQGQAGAAMIISDDVDKNGKISILHMTNDYGKELANAVKTSLESANYTGINQIGYSEEEENFSKICTDATANGENIVYLSSYLEDAALIITELKNQGYKGKIYAGDGPAGVKLYEKVDGNTILEGLKVTFPRTDTSLDYDVKKRYDENAENIGGNKTDVLAVYDAVSIMCGAAILTLNGTVAELPMKDVIEFIGTNYEGASGLITFLENGDINGSGYDICTYTGYTEDENKGYSCTHIWTAEDGIQTVSS